MEKPLIYTKDRRGGSTAVVLGARVASLDLFQSFPPSVRSQYRNGEWGRADRLSCRKHLQGEELGRETAFYPCRHCRHLEINGTVDFPITRKKKKINSHPPYYAFFPCQQVGDRDPDTQVKKPTVSKLNLFTGAKLVMSNWSPKQECSRRLEK